MTTVMTQHCQNCHAEIRDGMARCRECGTTVSSQPPATTPGAELPLFSNDGRLYSRCPECGKKIKAQRELAGKLIKCPRCDGPVRIPHLVGQDAPHGSSVITAGGANSSVETTHVGAGPPASGEYLSSRSSGQHISPNGMLPQQPPPFMVPANYPQFPGQPIAYGVPQGFPPPGGAAPPTVAPPPEESGQFQIGQTSSATPATENPSKASGLLSGVEVSRLHAICAACGKRVNAASTFAGHKVACPRCGEMIRLPGEPPKQPSSSSSLASTASTESTSSGQNQSMVMSALLIRSVEAALEFPPSIPETPAEQIQPLPKKTLRKHLDLVKEVSCDAKSLKKDAALEALQSIGTSHDVSAVPELIECLKTASGTIKLRLTSTLGELRCPESFETILRRIVTASGPELAACLQALGSLGDVRGALPILYAIQRYPDQRIRGFDAVVAMGKPALSELSRIAAEVPESDVHYAVAEMLSRFTSACPVDTFSRLMTSSSQSVRRRAAESLASVADGNAAGMLNRALQDEDPVVRMFAACGLQKAPSPSATSSLLRAIDDCDRDVRLAALQALGQCDQQAVRAALLKRLDDPDAEVAVVAAEALARMGDSNGVPRLSDILESQPPSSETGLALKIIEAFRKLKDKRATLPLLNLLMSDDAVLRLRAVEALSQVGDRGSRAALEKLLRFDPSDDVRAASAKALGDLGDHDAREALEAALHDHTPIRLKAVIALGQMRAKESLPKLLPLLEDPSPQIKYQTLKALGEIRDASAIAAIEPLVDSSDEMLRRAALKALQELGDKRAESDVRKSVKKSVKEEKKSKTYSTVGPRRRSNPLAKLAAPLLSVVDIVRYNRKVSLGIVTIIALAAAAVWFFNGRGGNPVGNLIRGTVASVSISEDGRFIAAGRSHGLLEIWDVEAQEVAGTSVDLPTQFVAFGPEGTSLLGIRGTRVAVAEIEDGEFGETTEISQLGARVIDFNVNQARTYAVSLCADQLIYRWNLASPKVEPGLQSSQPLMAVAISNDGAQVAGATKAGTLVIWNFETGEIISQTQASIVGEVSALAFQQDGPHVAAGTGNGELILWNTESSLAPSVDHSSQSGVSILAFPPGGEAVVCRLSGQVERWKIADNSLTTFRSPLDGITSMSTGGDQLALGSEEMTEVVLMNIATGTVEKTLDQ